MFKLIFLFLVLPFSAMAEDWSSIPWDVKYYQYGNIAIREAGLGIPPNSGLITYIGGGAGANVEGKDGGVLELANNHESLRNSAGRVQLISGNVPTGRIGLNVTHEEGSLIVQSGARTKMRYFPAINVIEFLGEFGQKEGCIIIRDGSLFWESRSGKVTLIAGE